MMMVVATTVFLRLYLVLSIITSFYGLKLQREGFRRSKQLADTILSAKKFNRILPISHRILYSFSTDTKSSDTLNQLDPILSDESATIITQQSIDKPTHQTKEIVISNDNPLSVLTLSFIKELEKVLNRKADFPAINEFTTESCSWTNPFISNIKESSEEIEKFSNFFSDTRIVVFNQRVVSPNTVEIDYQLSFWYPLPWRPRIIIPSVAIVKFDRSGEDKKLRISSITEKWEVTLAEIFVRQMLPRWWDVWHVFCSPSPEYPPIRTVRNPDYFSRVKLVELPQTMTMEVLWSGAAKYPGPPLLAVPGFALFGSLKNSRPNRDPFFTSLPVEVLSAKFTNPADGLEMKKSTWRMHVPTALQSQVMSVALSGQVYPLLGERLSEAYAKPDVPAVEESNVPELMAVDAKDGGVLPILVQGDDKKVRAIQPGKKAVEPDEMEEMDYVVGYENMNIIRSVTAGAQRGRVNVDLVTLKDFESKEEKAYRYVLTPKRLVAAVDVKGELDSQKISKALNEIKSSPIFSTPIKEKSSTRRYRVKAGNSGSSSSSESSDSTNINDVVFGLLLLGTKACFNLKAEPAMAIYEMQYDQRVTTVFVEVEEC